MNFRYFIQLSYKGTNYHGWQFQPNAQSIQEIVTYALSTVLRKETTVTGAGRTDTGVHASYYIGHFDSKESLLSSNKKFLYNVNSILPDDIAIHNIFSVIPDAHARFNALKRTYQYYIHQRKDPFLNEVSYFFPYRLNVDLMNISSKLLLSYTDFTSFSKLHSDVKTNNCDIHEAEWVKEGYKIVFTITANRFLRNMVRAIVGTILDVGKNKISIEDFIRIVESKNRSDAGISVPATGLFLTNIEYDKSIFL